MNIHLYSYYLPLYITPLCHNVNRFSPFSFTLSTYLGNSSQKVLQRYLFRYRPRQADSLNEYVFLANDGKSLTENSLKLMFSRLAQRSGVKRLHAHLCRHTFATKFLINGGDVFTLQQILGHSTLEMVRHYVNLASNQVALQHRRFSPLDRLNLQR